jgi:FixJ family two-component response regulator
VIVTSVPNGDRTEPPIIHVVDDDEPMATAMARLVRAAGFSARTYKSAAALLAVPAPLPPGCIILDVRMPDLSGLDMQKAIAAREDRLPIIFLTGHAEVPDSVRAIQRGAVDFLTKPVEAPVLLDAVMRALAQDAAERAERERQRALKALYDQLTAREREVFAHLITGQLNKQVAADLEISERTIKLHRARIFEKLRVSSIAGLTRLALDLGIESPQPPARPKDH